MENHGDPIPRKKKGIKVATKKRNVKRVKAGTLENKLTYGIDRINLADTEHADNDYVLG